MVQYGSVERAIVMGFSLVYDGGAGGDYHQLSQFHAAGLLLPRRLYHGSGYLVLVGLHQWPSRDQLQFILVRDPKKPDDLSDHP